MVVGVSATMLRLARRVAGSRSPSVIFRSELQQGEAIEIITSGPRAPGRGA